MKNYWFWLLVLVLVIPGCRYVVEDEEANLRLYCDPSAAGPSYFDGREYHWEFDVTVAETSGDLGVELVYFQYEIIRDGIIIGHDSGNCGFIRDFFGESCYLNPGERWSESVEITSSYRTEMEVNFLIVGFDDNGLEFKVPAQFRAWD